MFYIMKRWKKKSVDKGVREKNGTGDNEKNMLGWAKRERSNEENIKHCQPIQKAKKSIIVNQYKFL